MNNDRHWFGGDDGGDSVEVNNGLALVNAVGGTNCRAKAGDASRSHKLEALLQGRLPGGFVVFCVLCHSADRFEFPFDVRAMMLGKSDKRSCLLHCMLVA